MYIYMYIYIHICVYIYIYMCIHIYIYIYICIYIYVCVPMRGWVRCAYACVYPACRNTHRLCLCKCSASAFVSQDWAKLFLS